MDKLITPDRYAGKAVFVTGAAGGIGRATALRLGAEGAQVWCADIQGDLAETTAKDIEAAGGHAAGGGLDVSDSGAVTEAVEAAVGAFGRLDVLCNVAGVGRSVHTAEETDDNWHRTLAVNLDGPFFLSRAALPHLLEHGGNIVNVASTAGIQGQAYVAAYCASKHGVVGLTRAMAIEFGRKGLRVNAVCPGGTNTGIIGGFAPPEGANMHLVSRAFLVDSLTEPEEIAGLIAFLGSDEASYVNGAVYAIDGGTTAG